MFDPLSPSNSGFGSTDNYQPPWPTTPRTKTPIPGLRRAPSPVPPPPDKGPVPGLYGKEPQIYGQPEPGLISPRETVGTNGQKFEKLEPYLRVRVTGLDRNRRDILVKLDAQTNLSNFTGTTYRNVSRSYLEFQLFYDSIIHNNPQTIIPALPLPQTSAPTDEEDDRLIRIMLQRWITRVCEDPILLNDEDVRSFIESDFGYQPLPRPRRKASSGFSLIKRGVPDEDEQLQRARFELTKLESQFFETAKAVDKIALARKSLAVAHSEMGNKLINVATTEAHPNLGNALRKIGRVWHSLADLDQAQAISECVIVGDCLGYQAINARSAKETLLQRTGVLEEYQAAVKTTISKRRQIERMKASSNIRPERVDEALEEIEEASKYEQILAKRAEGISQNLHRALETHNAYANDDITSALIEHTRSSIMYEKQLLKELEALRIDVANAAKKVIAAPNVPKPTIIPPLEDYSRPSLTPVPQQPVSTPPIIQSQPSSIRPNLSAPSSSTQSPVAQHRSDPLSASDTLPRAGLPPPSIGRNVIIHPTHLPQSPDAGPSSSSSQPRPLSASADMMPSPGPPLGGRFADGTKSMFVKHTSSPLVSPAPTSASTQFRSDPLHGTPSYQTGPNGVAGAPYDPLSAPVSPHPLRIDNSSDSLDPLGQAKPQLITGSVRVQPTRSRLDAREAASKLANMF